MTNEIENIKNQIFVFEWITRSSTEWVRSFKSHEKLKANSKKVLFEATKKLK